MALTATKGMNVRSSMSRMNGHSQGPRQNEGKPNYRSTEFPSHGWVHEPRIAGSSNKEEKCIEVDTVINDINRQKTTSPFSWTCLLAICEIYVSDYTKGYLDHMILREET